MPPLSGNETLSYAKRRRVDTNGHGTPEYGQYGSSHSLADLRDLGRACGTSVTALGVRDTSSPDASSPSGLHVRVAEVGWCRRSGA
jgi:hypothetical protein